MYSVFIIAKTVEFVLFLIPLVLFAPPEMPIKVSPFKVVKVHKILFLEKSTNKISEFVFNAFILLFVSL